VFVCFGQHEVPVPEPLGALLHKLIRDRKSHIGVGSPTNTRWLFPGGLPGRPITASRLADRLRALGINSQPARRAALIDLAAQLPAAVLADLLNLHPTTAVLLDRPTASRRRGAQRAGQRPPTDPVLTATPSRGTRRSPANREGSSIWPIGTAGARSAAPAGASARGLVQDERAGDAQRVGADRVGGRAVDPLSATPGRSVPRRLPLINRQPPVSKPGQRQQMQPPQDHVEHQPSLQQVLVQTRRQLLEQVMYFLEVQQWLAAAFIRGSTTPSSRSPSRSIASIIGRSSSLGSGRGQCPAPVTGPTRSGTERAGTERFGTLGASAATRLGWRLGSRPGKLGATRP
jgi:hypothetical protein